MDNPTRFQKVVGIAGVGTMYSGLILKTAIPAMFWIGMGAYGYWLRYGRNGNESN